MHSRSELGLLIFCLSVDIRSYSTKFYKTRLDLAIATRLHGQPIMKTLKFTALSHVVNFAELDLYHVLHKEAKEKVSDFREED